MRKQHVHAACCVRNGKPALLYGKHVSGHLGLYIGHVRTTATHLWWTRSNVLCEQRVFGPFELRQRRVQELSSGWNNVHNRGRLLRGL